MVGAGVFLTGALVALTRALVDLLEEKMLFTLPHHETEAGLLVTPDLAVADTAAEMDFGAGARPGGIGPGLAGPAAPLRGAFFG